MSEADVGAAAEAAVDGVVEDLDIGSGVEQLVEPTPKRRGGSVVDHDHPQARNSPPLGPGYPLVASAAASAWSQWTTTTVTERTSARHHRGAR